MPSIAILGEYNPNFHPHPATDAALRHSADHLRIGVEARWIRTDAEVKIEDFDGILVAPGSPYASFDGVLRSIRVCRESGIPTLATCGGCQHLIIEYARNVLGYKQAHHAEYNSGSPMLFITELVCSLAGKRMSVHFRPGSLLGEDPVEEEYYCNFGLNRAYEQELERGGLAIEARDQEGEPRIFALPGHPFFVGTIFVPQARSAPGSPHPLITAFLQAASI